MSLETNIAHSIATFSELAIAISAVLIADVGKWKDAVRTLKASDPIAIESFMVKAREIGLIFTCGAHVVKFCHTSMFRLTPLVFLLPYASIIFACLALWGIAVYPQPFSTITSTPWPPIDRGSSDLIYMWMAFGSFSVSLGAACFENFAANVVGKTRHEEGRGVTELLNPKK